MSIELSETFNQIVKRVEFFPYEWNVNLLAVVFSDSIKFFNLIEELTRKEDTNSSLLSNVRNETASISNFKLHFLANIQFQQKIDQFSWSPQTFTSNIKPTLNFAVCDGTQYLLNCTYNLNVIQNREIENDLAANLDVEREKLDVDSIFNISFDHQNGETLALTADNFCFLWDYCNKKLKARFQLQSPGINICWNKDEKTKLMVGEKIGIIRIYNIETLKPLYTLMCNSSSIIEHNPLLSFDWSESNPEFVVGSSINKIMVWNTFNSCLPDKILDSFVKIRMIKIGKFKENTIGFIDGRDAASKLTVMNVKTNQIIYQSQSLKLLESYSFNATLPVMAISNEHQLLIAKIVNY